MAILIPIFIVLVLFWILGGPEYGGWPDWAPMLIIGIIVLAVIFAFAELYALTLILVVILILFICSLTAL
jgi:hypothetical protein